MTMSDVVAPSTASSESPGSSPGGRPAPVPISSLAHATTAIVDQLITGRQLNFPIYDLHGVLLLAEGSTITSEFKRRLKNWNIHAIQGHPVDVGHVTRGPSTEETSEFSGLDAETAATLAQLMESGPRFAATSVTRSRP